MLLNKILLALLITISLEGIIWYLLTMPRFKFYKIMGFSLLINSATLPIANYFYLQMNFPGKFLLFEIIIFVIEAFLILLLLKINITKSLKISFIANLSTAILSIFLN
jgi:hypothetical protein